MARGNNLPAKKYKAGERTELSLRFTWNAGDGNTTSTIYIDLAKALSMVNRRAYRQGLYYYVASVEFSNGSEAYCQVNTLPRYLDDKTGLGPWVQDWSKMNRIAAADGHPYPKYHDFKTQMVNGASITDPGYGDIDSDGGGTGIADVYTADDWVTSDFVTDDPPGSDPEDVDTFSSHMLGGHAGSAGSWTSIGLIRSLNDTWAYQPDEGVPTLDAGGDADTDPLANMFDAGDSHDDIRLNLDQDNDEPPYDHNTMTGASSAEETVIKAILRTGVGAGALARAPGFCAPLGLLQVNVSDFGALDAAGQAQTVGVVELRINLVPGTYNGVYAERIL